ncbi:hypothetical protein ACFQ88_06310 [Paenibacillus sp. NPDC056579]
MTVKDTTFERLITGSINRQTNFTHERKKSFRTRGYDVRSSEHI